MYLRYFKSKDGNFGDDLNPYIFQKLFPSTFISEDDGIDFYGIGTIIDDRINPEKHSIFFGTGIRDIAKTYDKTNWEVFFLRGPISSNTLGYNGEKYITDSAYLFPLVNDSVLQSSIKKHKLSIIPHFEHINSINWSLVSQFIDFNLIDIRDSVEKVVEQICASERIITSAMHGAIMADICRVPWIRLKMSVYPSETLLVSDIKWNDWLLSLSLKNDSIKLESYTFNKKPILKSMFYIDFIRKLKKTITNGSFQLSEDKIYNHKLNQLNDQVNLFKNKYM